MHSNHGTTTAQPQCSKLHCTTFDWCCALSAVQCNAHIYEQKHTDDATFGLVAGKGLLKNTLGVRASHYRAHLSSCSSELTHNSAHSHLSFYSFELLLIWGSMMRWARDSSRMPEFEKEETVTLPKQRWINQTLTVSDKTPKCTEMSSPQLK